MSYDAKEFLYEQWVKNLPLKVLRNALKVYKQQMSLQSCLYLHLDQYIMKAMVVVGSDIKMKDQETNCR